MLLTALALLMGLNLQCEVLECRESLTQLESLSWPEISAAVTPFRNLLNSVSIKLNNDTLTTKMTSTPLYNEDATYFELDLSMLANKLEELLYAPQSHEGVLRDTIQVRS